MNEDLLSNAPIAILEVDSSDLVVFANAVAQSLALPCVGSVLGDPELVAFAKRVRCNKRALHDPAFRGANFFGHVAGAPTEQGCSLFISVRRLEPLDLARLKQDQDRTLLDLLQHEARTPLAGIKGAAQLAQRSARAEDVELLAVITREADRLERLFLRLADLGKFAQPVFAPVDVASLARDAIAISQAAFLNGPQIAERLDPALPDLRADRDHLMQALLNLIRNAVEAPATARIVVTTRLRVGERLGRPGAGLRLAPIEIAVQDDGPGFAGAEVNGLAASAGNATPRKGLGLALVQEILAAHHGFLEVDSRPGRTELRMVLPQSG